MLEAHRLTKHYKDRAKGGRFCVLHEASLTLHEGEAVGLMGKSGSGKSTLVRLLLGLEIPDGGEVRWRGKDVFSLARNELRDFRRSVQFISQTPGTFFDPRYTLERSLREALQVQDVAPRAIWRECIAEQLVRVGLNENAEAKVVEYLADVGDSKKAEREATTINIMIYFLILSVFAGLWKSKIWSKLH